MKWGLWSSLAASNNSTPPDGWPEGQLPSTVNDCAREMMAAVKIGIKDIQFIDLGVTPTRTGNGTFTMTGDQTQWFGYGNRVKAFDAGALKYGTVISSTFTTVTGVTLRMDLGEAALLTASMSAVAVGFPTSLNPAAPEQVYRNKNYCDNAALRVWQRGPGPFAISSAPLFIADRFSIESSNTAGFACNVTRSSNVPTVQQGGGWMDSSIQISISVGNATIAAGHFFNLRHAIEGYDYKEMYQKPITVSFWAQTRETGTYCCNLRNTGLDRSCVIDFNISTVAAWEKKVISFPKPPTTGTWDYSAGVGLYVGWCFASGTTFRATAGAWTSMNALASSSIGNITRSAGNATLICGFKIIEGGQEIPLIHVPYHDDLLKCRRYVQPQPNRAFGHAFGPSNAVYDYPLTPSMRQPPSMSVLTALTNMIITTGTAGQVSVSGVAVLLTTNERCALFANPVGAPLTAGQGSMLFASAPSGGSTIMFKCEI